MPLSPLPPLPLAPQAPQAPQPDTPLPEVVSTVVDFVALGFEVMLALRKRRGSLRRLGCLAGNGWQVPLRGGRVEGARVSQAMSAVVRRGGVAGRPLVFVGRRNVSLQLDCVGVSLNGLGGEGRKVFSFKPPASADMTQQDLALRYAISAGLSERFPGSLRARRSFGVDMG